MRVLSIVILSLAVLVVFWFSTEVDMAFDKVFSTEVTVVVIAHRGGGAEGSKNTAKGILIAADPGSFGSEIDIQRMKDGHYFALHENAFQLVSGDRHKPDGLTLEELRKLTVDDVPISTFEETLEVAHGLLILFTELKGTIANRQMIDDSVRKSAKKEW